MHWLKAADERLSPEQVQVWTASVSQLDAAALEACAAIESDEERRRRMRLRHESDRRQRLLGAALLRSTLSRYSGIDPRAWVFERNEHGRPELVAGQTAVPLRFNLSHAGGLVACGVTLGRDIGVDVESVERRGETVAIADRYFSPDEVRDLRSVAEPDRRRRFFEYWTLKESYVKARGLGLALALRKLSFRLADGEVGVRFAPDLADDPDSWQFALFRPTPSHVLAVGVRQADAEPLSIRLREA